MKWVDNHRGVFNVEVVTVSAIHTQVTVFGGETIISSHPYYLAIIHFTSKQMKNVAGKWLFSGIKDSFILVFIATEYFF